MRACKKAAVVFVLLAAVKGFSQNSQAIDMPSITMPEAPKAPQMPSASTPSVGSFYIPGLKNQQQKNNLNEAAAGDNASSASQPDASQTGSARSAEAKSLAESLAGKNLLTATDITSLYDSGLFGSLASITGGGLTGAGNAAGAGNASLAGNASSGGVSDVMLKKILDNLEEMKKSQQNLSPEKQQELDAYQKDSKLFKTRDPKILRFRINGYNIADSVASVFFSEAEPDGTFLLTGDRVYYADGRKRTETFYLLFKAVKSNGAEITYNVQPSIVQDFENQNSFVYRFAKLSDLKAEKTGNLVALHTVSDDLNVDLLLDIDCDK